jgi:hypothetical protein
MEQRIGFSFPKRGRFHEIIRENLCPSLLAQVAELVEEVARGSVDEHGSWDFRANLDSKRRGEALNWDMYGIGHDYHSGKLLAVIQVRQYRKQCANWWPSIRKNYFLLGRNEDDTPFAHPVQAMVVRSAIRRKQDVIKAVQDWLWETDYSRVVRQGDIGMIPGRVPGAAVPHVEPVCIENSHVLTADEIRWDGRQFWALNPRLVHSPGTHPDVSATGWLRIKVSKRAPAWQFAPPTRD